MTGQQTDEELIKKALGGFLATLPKEIDGDDIEHVFASYGYLSGNIVGIGLQRTIEGLVPLTRDLPVGGTMDIDPSVTVWHRQTDDDGPSEVFHILAGGRKYTLEHAPRREQPTDAENGIREIELCSEDAEGDIKRLASVVLMREGDEYMPGHGWCRKEHFYDFMDFMDAVRPALGGYLSMIEPFAPMKNGVPNFAALMAANEHPIVDRDGFLPGDVCRSTVRNMFRIATTRLSDYMASVLPDIVSGAEARGITWGNAFLRYNDHDNSVTAIPTTVEGRSALYHRNTSLIFDHNAAILWCDRDPDGNVIEFGAAALVPGDERLLAAVEAVAKGEEIADAPILRRRPQDKTIDFEDFFNTGGVTSFAHYVAFDHEEIVGGQMDVSRDSDIQTNFDEIYFDTAEFVDEDVDEDDEEDLPLP